MYSSCSVLTHLYTCTAWIIQRWKRAHKISAEIQRCLHPHIHAHKRIHLHEHIRTPIRIFARNTTVLKKRVAGENEKKCLYLLFPFVLFTFYKALRLCQCFPKRSIPGCFVARAKTKLQDFATTTECSLFICAVIEHIASLWMALLYLLEASDVHRTYRGREGEWGSDGNKKKREKPVDSVGHGKYDGIVSVYKFLCTKHVYSNDACAWWINKGSYANAHTTDFPLQYFAFAHVIIFI